MIDINPSITMIRHKLLLLVLLIVECSVHNDIGTNKNKKKVVA